MLTFRFLTEGSGEVDFRVKIYLPISWRRVEYFGFLAGRAGLARGAVEVQCVDGGERVAGTEGVADGLV